MAPPRGAAKRRAEAEAEGAKPRKKAKRNAVRQVAADGQEESAKSDGKTKDDSFNGAPSKKRSNSKRKKQTEGNSKSSGKKKVDAVNDGAAFNKKGNAKIVKQTEDWSSSNLRLMVKNIPWSIDEETLRKDFEECGKVINLKLLLDSEGQSRGMAFITYEDVEGFNAALEYNGTDYGGQLVSVRKAEVKGAGKGALGAKPEGCNSVVVKRLALDATSDDLHQLFRNCGSGPKKVGLLYDKTTGRSRGTARIDFHDSESVDHAVKLLGTSFKGQPLVINYCQPKTW